MCLVKHPHADLPLIKYPPQGTAAQLFRRNNEYARVPESYLVKSLCPFRHGQQSVCGHARNNALGRKSRHLIRHERNQRGDYNCQSAGLIVAREGRDLIAKRLASARGHNTENMVPRHHRLNYGSLHWSAVIIERFPAEI